MVLVLVQEWNSSVPVIFVTVLKMLGFKSGSVSAVQCSAEESTVVIVFIAVAFAL